jgi:hypothetical protein
MQSSSSSLSLSLREPLLATDNVADERYSVLDQAIHHSSVSLSQVVDKEGGERPSKNWFIANKNELGFSSCIHWYNSKFFLFRLLVITQHVMTIVLLVPFMSFQFGFEDEAKVAVNLLPPRLVIASSMTLFVMLIWLYIHEKAPSQEFLLGILHPGILVEMNIALMLILNKKEKLAIATLLISMLGVGALVLFSVQNSSSRNKNTVKEKTDHLVTV